MLNALNGLADWVGDVIYSWGYVGVAVLIALQNLFPPVPSALILPLAGFLVGQGRFSFFPVVMAATVGSVVSALVFYALGYWLGRERVRDLTGRFGKLVMVDQSDLDRSLTWFESYGAQAVVICRLIPGLGTLISIPAGFVRMSVPWFVLYTIAGTAVWNGAFVGLGWALGARWQLAQRYLHVFQYVLLAAAFAGAVWFVWRRWRRRG